MSSKPGTFQESFRPCPGDMSAHNSSRVVLKKKPLLLTSEVPGARGDSSTPELKCPESLSRHVLFSLLKALVFQCVSAHYLAKPAPRLLLCRVLKGNAMLKHSVALSFLVHVMASSYVLLVN